MKKVNFIEAVSSGKRFRLVNNINYDIAKNFSKEYFTLTQFLEEINEHYGSLVFSHLVQAEYELEEKKITITEREFDEAVNKVKESSCFFEHSFEFLRKELGF